MQPSFKWLTSILLLTSLSSAATVTLGDTTIVGQDISSQRLEFFGGIPFAEPPVGNLRLKPPVQKSSLDTSVFDATSFGASCLQVPVFGSADLSNTTLSEDCLFVNIIRPAGIEKRDASLLPVMVYIYGGGFLIDGPAPNANASSIVTRSVERGTPIIYVSFNYRLGPLGFPAGQEAADKGALNLGLRDQLAALEWIQTNIAAFGGDKDKVTLFGSSAGAVSISTLFFNSDLEKYARAAIMESGIAGTTISFDPARRQNRWESFVAAIPECKDIAQSNDTFDCLRRDNISATHFIQAIRTSLDEADELFPWVPTIDGPEGLFPELASVLLKKGQYSKIPFITGNTLDEGTIFTASTIIASEQSMRQALIGNFTTVAGTSDPDPELNNAVDTILKLYPDIPALGSPFNTGNETFGLSTTYKRLSAIYTDMAFHFPRRSWIRTLAQAGVNAYGYQFSYPELNPSPALGVAHSSELNYVVGFEYFPSSFVPSATAAMVSEQIIDYWVSFATSLNPNDGLGSDRPVWPRYTVDDPVLLQLNGSDTGPFLDTYRSDKFDFVDSNPVIFRH